MVFFSSCI
ncbi:hypothetical protein D043_3285A, partial [Vibrio parahaemolyticus EKP-021]